MTRDMGAVAVPFEGAESTAFGWPIVKAGLRDLLVGLRERYGAALPPIYVTENGAAFDDDVPDGAGRVHDPGRVDFLAGHLRALAEAMAAGVDVRGYFAWSLLDNFECPRAIRSGSAWSTSTFRPGAISEDLLRLVPQPDRLDPIRGGLRPKRGCGAAAPSREPARPARAAHWP
jgi:Glycosyl hydrolase family 1